VLERAAVVGRDAPLAAVAALSERDVAEDVETLRDRGLVDAARGALRFHHVLIRDVAYEAITKERRSKLHERVAAWLDAEGGADDAIVGYHLEQAYRYSAELGAPAAALGTTAGARLGRAGVEAWKRADAPAAVNLLGRAAALLPRGEVKAETLCELAVAWWSAGEGERVRETLDEALAVAAATASRRAELRAGVERAYAGLFGIGGLSATPEEALAIAADAIPILEEANDDRSLGRAWQAVADVHNLRLNMPAWSEAAAFALRHYRRTGFSPAVCLMGQAAALYYGATPVRAGLARCDELIDDADGDRQAVAGVTLFAAALGAMRGEFDAARTLVAGARATFEEHGADVQLAGTVNGVAAGIERLAGALTTAEALLRDSRSALARMNQAAYMATRSAQLADVLVDRGELDEAEALLDAAVRTSPAHDVTNEALVNGVRGRLLARRGDGAGAEAAATRAVDVLSATDALDMRARAALDLAEILSLAGRRRSEIRALVEEAVRLYRRKGNTVGAGRAAALLGETANAPH
jgi:tetratricopeptide (TPR) repeat protein